MRSVSGICRGLVLLCFLLSIGCGGGGGSSGSDTGLVRILPVNVSYVGPASGSDDTESSIEDAVERWARLFDQVGILLDVKYYNFDGPRDLPDPQKGDPLYTRISSETRASALNLVIGVDVKGLQGASNENFGEVGGSPGSTTPGPRSVAVFSITRVAGEDGKFNYDGQGSTQLWDDEIEVGSEVLAGLAGEYLGLQPVVTFKGNKVIATDGLSDTASCVTEVECREEDTPRDNVMFPRVYKKPGEGNKTYSRNQLSPQQGDILLASPLVQF
ncbi:MAG: hypothetical protein EBZ48_04000 [Proteobacteria bacterium]|nr:hypothetical protein [Pseudomonadota bacterium]